MNIVVSICNYITFPVEQFQGLRFCSELKSTHSVTFFVYFVR